MLPAWIGWYLSA
uniref:Uncharacterized protein n=1 Tax=Arundo donax TaxID=35708 RepID=A0A0A9FUE3_ARUDO